MLWGGGAGNSSEWTPFQPWGQEEGDVWSKHLSENAFPFTVKRSSDAPPESVSSFSFRVVWVQIGSLGPTTAPLSPWGSSVSEWGRHFTCREGRSKETWFLTTSSVAKHSWRVHLISFNWACCSPFIVWTCLNYVSWSLQHEGYTGTLEQVQGLVPVSPEGGQMRPLPQLTSKSHKHREKSTSKTCRDLDHPHRLWLCVSFPGFRNAEQAKENYPEAKLLQFLFVYT